MRATRVLRCTRCTGSSSGRRSAWTLGHFWDERAYLASPNAKKLLMTVAVMAALGYTSATATTNPPATVIGSAGTLQYAAHNFCPYSENMQGVAWSYISSALALDAQTISMTTSTSYFGQAILVGVAAGQPYTMACEIMAGTKTGIVKFRDANAAYGTVVTLTSTWQKVSFSGVCNGGNVFPVFDTRLAQGGDGGTGTILVRKVQVCSGAAAIDYVATTSAAVYAAPITYDRGASSNLKAHSEDLTDGAYVVSGILSRAASSSGLPGLIASANLFIPSTANAAHAMWTDGNPSGFAVGTTQVVSWVQGPGGYTKVNFQLGASYTAVAPATNTDYDCAAPNGYMIALGGGWYRCFAIYTRTGSTDGYLYFGINGAGSFTGNGTSGVYVSGFQVSPGTALTPYLRTSTAPLHTAGTPKSQNLLPNSDPAQSPWSNDGAVTATTTTGETRIQFSGANQGRNVGITTLVGCVYTVAVDVKPTSPADAGTAIRIGTNSAQSIVTLTAGYQTVYISVVETTSGVCTFNTYSGGTCRDITVRNVRVYEGTDQLPYVATTGTPYSLYYQQGLITEAARTRETLHPRDLTQAAWIKSNATAAKTATGLDGVANSSTTITATAGAYSGGFYQVVSSASANRLFHLRVRSRSAATVACRITTNAWNNYLDIVATPQWQSFMVSFATVTSPVYGLTLANNGDSIDVDFVQGEQYTTLPAVPPMPIWGTESAAQTKSADLVRTPASWASDAGPQTTVMRVNPNATNFQILFGRQSDGRLIYINSVPQWGIYDGTNACVTGTPVAGVPAIVATRYSAGGLGISVNGGSIATTSFDGSMGTNGATPALGDDGAGGSHSSGLIGSIEIASTAMNDATFQRAALGLVA